MAGSILTKAAKLEIIALMGEVINEAGGLSVNGTMIGEGGVQLIVNPLATETASKTELQAMVDDYIGRVNAGLPSDIADIEYRYVPDKDRPMFSGAWKLKDGDIGSKHFDFSIDAGSYAEVTNEVFIVANGKNKIYVYDGDDYSQKMSIDTLALYDKMIVSVEGTRLFLRTTDHKHIHIYNKIAGVYVKTQDMVYNYGNYGLNFDVDASGSTIVTSASLNNYGRQYAEIWVLSAGGSFTRVTTKDIYGNQDHVYHAMAMISPAGDYMFFISNGDAYLNGTNTTYATRNSDGTFTWGPGLPYLADPKVPAPLRNRWTDDGSSITVDKTRWVSVYNKKLDIYKQNQAVDNKENPINRGGYRWAFADTLNNTAGGKNFTLTEGTTAPTYEINDKAKIKYGDKYLKFDGSGILNLANMEAFEKQNITYAFWLQVPTVSAAFNPIFVQNASIDTNLKGRGILIGTKDGKLIVKHGSGDNTFEVVTGTKDVEDGAWHHINVTVEQGGRISILVDKVLDVQENVSPSTISYDNGLHRFQMGGIHENSNDPAQYGKFSIADLHIYPDYKLTQDDLKLIVDRVDKNSIEYDLEFTVSEPNDPETGNFGTSYIVSVGWDKLFVVSPANNRAYQFVKNV